jgi:Ala-tRNA(Pro) deacylase
MSISTRVQQYLESHKVPYQIIHHDYAETAKECADEAHIPSGRMTKAVVLEDDEGYMMALVPADKKVDLNAVNLRTNRLLSRVSQKTINHLFSDCTQGAVPAVGQAYGMRVIWDDSITEEPDCYLEAGDHKDLLYLSRSDFMNLMKEWDHGRISH